jgi:hypothetical protein
MLQRPTPIPLWPEQITDEMVNAAYLAHDDMACREPIRPLLEAALRAAPKQVVALSQRQAEPVQANFPEERLQTVAERVGDKCEVWRGIGARDVEEVLRQALRLGLVTPQQAEPVQAEPVSCGHESCDCRGYCKRKQAEPVAWVDWVWDYVDPQQPEPVDKALTKSAPKVDKEQAEPVSALTRYNEIAEDVETYTGNALERLRIFCSLAMTGEDWLDAEPFFDAAEAELSKLDVCLVEINWLKQQAEPVVQFRKRHCAEWYDGHADHEDGGGPYQERVLYTRPPPQPEPVDKALTKSAPKVDKEQAEPV